DGHRSAGDVVVVEAGVVAGHPADQPERQMRVAEELLENPLGRVVAHQALPQLRLPRQRPDEVPQLLATEVGLACDVDHRTASRTPAGSDTAPLSIRCALSASSW